MTRSDDSRPDDSRESGGDEDAVDRAFAELIAGYHLTADRPDPLPSAGTRPAPEPLDTSWSDDHPLFRFEEQEPEPSPVESVEHYDPPAPEPVPKLAWPVLIGWLGMGYAVLVMLAVMVGIRLPVWAAWLGLIGFAGGFGILVACLPRRRPPDGNDGAVV